MGGCRQQASDSVQHSPAVFRPFLHILPQLSLPIAHPTPWLLTPQGTASIFDPDRDAGTDPVGARIADCLRKKQLLPAGGRPLPTMGPRPPCSLQVEVPTGSGTP